MKENPTEITPNKATAMKCKLSVEIDIRILAANQNGLSKPLSQRQHTKPRFAQTSKELRKYTNIMKYKCHIRQSYTICSTQSGQYDTWQMVTPVNTASRQFTSVTVLGPKNKCIVINRIIYTKCKGYHDEMNPLGD